MSFEELISSHFNISSIIENYHKITKINIQTHIYNNHIRDNNDNIYIDSISVNNLNHSKDVHFVNSHLPNNEKFELINKFINDIKMNSIFHDNIFFPYKNQLNTNYSNIIYLNNPLFYCNFTDMVWAHILIYGYTQIYFYYKLHKYIPDLILVLPTTHRVLNYLIDLLEIKNVILLSDQKIINDGPTYCAGNFELNFTDEIINDFYYEMIVKKTLQKYEFKYQYPKKILFLRKPENIVTNHFLQNREEIVTICNKYGYIDIDQTLMSEQEYIYLSNNATHIIQESGGSIIHLLWANPNIKSIIFDYSNVYCHTCANNFDYADSFLKFISNNMLCDIVKNKNSKIIFNDIHYIKTGIISKTDNIFIEIPRLIKAIEENE